MRDILRGSRAVRSRFVFPAATPQRCLPLRVRGWSISLLGLLIFTGPLRAQWTTQLASFIPHGEQYAKVIPLGRQDSDMLCDYGIFTDRLALYRGGSPLSSVPYRTISNDSASISEMKWVDNAGDFDGDGYEDWICASYRGIALTYSLEYYRGGVANAGPPVVCLSLNFQISALRSIGDFNGDGFDDFQIAYTGYYATQDSSQILFGSAAMDTIPDWTAHFTSGLWGRCIFKGSGDLNGDGYTDQLAFSSSPWMAYIYCGSAQPDTAPAITWMNFRADWPSTIIHDLNGDGCDELAIAYNDTVYIHFGRQQMSRAPDLALHLPSTEPSHIYLAGDVNRDGFQDFFVTEYGYSDGGWASLFLGYPWMSSQPTHTLSWGSSLYLQAIGLGDVNGEGTGDFAVVAQEHSTGQVGIQILAGNPNVQLASDPPTVNIPEQFHLTVFPNPFNAVATISFTLPQSANATLTLYNVQGRLIQMLRHGYLPAGTHSCSMTANGLASGVYFVRLDMGSHALSEKLLLLR